MKPTTTKFMFANHIRCFSSWVTKGWLSNEYFFNYLFQSEEELKKHGKKREISTKIKT